MLKKAVKLLRGSVCVRAKSAYPERMLNLCSARGIEFWDVRWIDDTALSFCVARGDLRSLRQIRHFRDAGFVDLQTIAPQWGIGEKSLRKLSAIVLGQRVSKAQRLSNWEAATFTDKQKLYAATDAWVCTAIYDKLLHTPKIKRPKA